MNMIARLFGQPKKSPEEQAKEWRRQLTKEQRNIDTQIRRIRTEEQNTIKAAKDAAKKEDLIVLKILANDILLSRKAVNRMITAKTHMNSISMQLQHQMSQLKMAGTISKSTEIMTSMNQLMRAGEVREVAMALGREMMKAGLIDEMISETMDDVIGDGVEEEELEEEVAKVVDEMMQSKMAGTRITTSRIPVNNNNSSNVCVSQGVREGEGPGEEATVEDEDENDVELMAKFQSLKNA
eukprot:Tbor_TRINITY_DN4987_c8_g3::TRINITY_DN4987_c8_g3_i1::g.9817::m.9817/K12193/VPS24, CHMP3; charged multivesicular body protein 3